MDKQPNPNTGAPAGGNQNKNQDTNGSKPMDSKREVEQSNDAKIEEDFPGYPHYPAKEDMMNQESGNHRVDADVENLSTTNKASVDQRFLAGQDRDKAKDAMIPGPATEDNLGLRSGTDSDVNSDDLLALNATNDEIGTPQNVSNEDINTDLDIPGSELDDDLESRGDEDEENNYYSLGGDRHESQEEDPQSGPVRDSY